LWNTSSFSTELLPSPKAIGYCLPDSGRQATILSILLILSKTFFFLKTYPTGFT
jgi:hypothetical protein